MDKRKESLEVFETFYRKRDRNLGLISKATHEIGLVPDAKSHHSVPHCVGIRMGDIKWTEVNKIVGQGVAVPIPSTDLAGSVAFTP